MKLKKYWRRFLVQLGIWKVKPEKEIIELLKKNTKVVEQEECDHKMLSALFPNDIWYRCTSCQQLWIITQAMTINADKMPKLIEKFNTIQRMKNKTKKVMSLKEYEKKKEGN